MSKIEWTDETINPIVGCSKISEGCLNCYAEKMAWRMAHNPKLSGEVRSAYQSVVSNGKWNGKVAFVSSAFDKLKTLKKPKRIFVGSMCDVFHDSVGYKWQEEVFDTILDYPQHTFIFLTKRPENIESFFYRYEAGYEQCGILELSENIWFGATVESQKYISRIDDLLKIPAKVRFISVEPMLSEVIIPQDKLRQLQWVICGGETGNGAREMKAEWAISLKRQCEDAGVPFFFKKWGGAIHTQSKEQNFEYSLKYGDYPAKSSYKDGFIDGVEYRQFPKGELV